eukprot:CAMPEP_0115296432 /NCGR_PEP_ID=MMETSP0270-20121206/67227_1 /TAXON_ID=71861 /ORGANISM="Scrippsiella trochoidea, Strain CCMP3099" /LENGTH=50 /DNA_ID=CAMNT_0002714053 /DNA_START=31 /DNA_END=180 /DNA_ORIENTATION=-
MALILVLGSIGLCIWSIHGDVATAMCCACGGGGSSPAPSPTPSQYWPAPA